MHIVFRPNSSSTCVHIVVLPRAHFQIQEDYKKFIRSVGTLLVRDSGVVINETDKADRIETFVNDAYDIEFQLANVRRRHIQSAYKESAYKELPVQRTDFHPPIFSKELVHYTF